MGRKFAGVLGWTGRSTTGFLRERKAVVRAIVYRMMWWSALGLLVLGGGVVLGHGELPQREIVLAPFVVALAICGVLRLVAAERHLRVAALGLGVMHGGAVVMVWSAFAG